MREARTTLTPVDVMDSFEGDLVAKVQVTGSVDTDQAWRVHPYLRLERAAGNSATVTRK